MRDRAAGDRAMRADRTAAGKFIAAGPLDRRSRGHAAAWTFDRAVLHLEAVAAKIMQSFIRRHAQKAVHLAAIGSGAEIAPAQGPVRSAEAPFMKAGVRSVVKTAISAAKAAFMKSDLVKAAVSPISARVKPAVSAFVKPAVATFVEAAGMKPAEVAAVEISAMKIAAVKAAKTSGPQRRAGGA